MKSWEHVKVKECACVLICRVGTVVAREEHVVGGSKTGLHVPL